MKGLTPIIGIILLLIVGIALAGSAYTFIFGVFESSSSKTIKISIGSEQENAIIVQNLGEHTIQPGEIKVNIDGKESVIVNPALIPPGEGVLVKFNPSAIKENANLRVIGPANIVTGRINTKGSLYEGLVLLHHADFDFTDASEFGNDGIPQNDTFVNTTGGCVGGAYQFDGSQDWINISFSPELDVIDESLNRTTVAMWVRVLNDSSHDFMISQNNGGGVGRIWLRFDNTDGDIDTFLGSTPATTLISDYPLDEQWHHIAFTYNGTNFTGFLDGVQNTTVTKPNIDENADGYYKIGSNKQGGSFFNGSIDELGIWRRILSPAEISQLYQKGLDAGC